MDMIHVIDDQGVLSTTSAPLQIRLSRVFEREFGVTLGRQVLDRSSGLLNVSAHSRLSLSVEAALWRSVIMSVADACKISLESEVAAALAEEVHYSHHKVLMPGALAALERLCRTGDKIVLLSNALPSLRVWLENRDLLRFFDGVVISSEVGMAKPDPALFRAIVSEQERAGRKVATLVDDTLDNVKAAVSVGYTGFLVDDERDYDPQNCYEVVSSLEAYVEQVIS
ncbi:MAG: HAD family hydrolase [Propionibacteriaceae bacterium]